MERESSYIFFKIKKKSKEITILNQTASKNKASHILVSLLQYSDRPPDGSLIY